MNIQQRFGSYIKCLRIESGLTQKEMQERLNMKYIYSYQRLESGEANVTLLKMAKLKKIFPDADFDSIFQEVK